MGPVADRGPGHERRPPGLIGAGLVLARPFALAFSAALLVVLLGPVAGPLPVAAARAAGTDLTLVGDATYTVVPDRGVVHVVVDFTVRNHTSETKTHKYYFDRASIAVIPGTTSFRVTGWTGSKVRVTKRTSAYTMLQVSFGSRLYSGATHALRLAFDLPDPGRATKGQVRIGPSLVTFPVWAFASDGARGSTVSVRFPAGYDVAVESGKFDRRSTAPDGGTVLATGSLASPLTFYAFVSGQRPAVYRDTSLAVTAGPQSIALTLKAWQDDPGWRARVASLLKGALPALRSAIGVPWPHADPLVVQEAVSRNDGGYAGLFDGGKDRIEVAYWADPLVVVHEAAHGWFNGGLLADRWANEAFASLYAGRAAKAMKVKGAGPVMTKAIAKAAIPLNAWASDGTADAAVEAYGYAASAALATAIAERAGDAALQRVWADAQGGIGAYQPVIPKGGAQGSATPGSAAQGSATPGGATPATLGGAAAPETVGGAADWRGLLDLLEAETGQSFGDLWRTWVVRGDEAKLLDARDAARASYARTLALANGWVLPRSIRDALRAWQFDAAEQLMAGARTVLAQRAALERLATRDGLALPSTMRGLFEAGSMSDASAEAEAERNAILAIGETTAARAADTDLLTSIGMIGEHPEADLQAARDAFAAGSLDATISAADDAYRSWNGAWQEGRRRVLAALAALATILVLASAFVRRIRRGRRGRLRPPLAAAALAVMLSAGVAILSPALAPSAGVPGAPSLAGLGVPVALAADDIEIGTAARYVVDPGHGLVSVTVDVTAINRKPSTVSGGVVTRYFYDGVNLGVQPEATHIRATQDGVAVKVTTSKRDGYRMVTVLFRGDIWFKETARVQLTFDLPAGKPRSASEVRVGKAFATFVAWAFGDRGTVRVEVPKGFAVDTSGSAMTPSTGSDGLQVLTATAATPLDWYAWIDARNDDGLTREQLVLAGGDRIVVRGWPEDPRWRDSVTSVLTDAVPQLAKRIGLPWPVAGPLTVIEVYTPLLEGYAGFYDRATDQITISEDLDDATIIHEASHAWFNDRLFTERWINEGLAEEYASRVLATDGGAASAPAAVKRTAASAFPLDAWPPPAPIQDKASDAREQYGYDASWTVIRAILGETGEAGMRRVFQAADAGTTAYVGNVPPERTRLPNDWRRFLDLSEELGGARSATALITKWAATPDAQASLTARTAARRDYHALLAAGDGWAAPVIVRMEMDAWTFDQVGEAMARADAVLEKRDGMVAAAAGEGLTPASTLEAAYEGATTAAGLDDALALADATATSLDEVVTARTVVEQPRDWLTSLGLDGEDPDAGLAAARAAWQAGDLEQATLQADEAVAALAAAPGNGRTKVLVVGGGAVGVVLVLGFAVVVVGRRRSGPATLARADDQYGTLRPSGPAGAMPDAPQPHDEGADRP